jgi:hypothetical protein
MQILHQNCDPSLAKDRNLPYSCYIVTYVDDGKVCYDLVIPRKQVEIFDYYWDRYREGLKGWKQSEGRVNPKLWSNAPKKKK